jgi:hypothetical protein
VARKAFMSGQNGFDALTLYEARKNYNYYSIETAIARSVPFTNQPAILAEYRSLRDFSRDKKYLIGKVSPEQFAIIPRPEMITRIKYTDGDSSLGALGFVQRAFDSMAERYDNLIFQNRTVTDEANAEGTLERIRAKVAYQSSVKEYIRLNNASYTIFVDNLPKATKDRIENLKDFLDAYVEYLLSPQTRIPYFLSDYIKSGYNPIWTTGLTIEIDDAPYSDDGYKVRKYLTNPNFRKFISLAQEFGFMIDKQVPWRLVADIDSKAMKNTLQRMGEQNVSIPYVIQNNFSVVDTNDFLFMLNDVYKAYNYFIKQNSYSDRTNSRIDTEKESRVIIRNVVGVEALSQVVNEEWITAFIKIKNKSTGLNMKEDELAMIINTEKRKVGFQSLDRIVTSINKKFNFTPFDEGSKTFKALRRLRTETKATTDPLQQIKDFYVANLLSR